MAFVSTSTLSNQAITAYQKSALLALRARTVFDQFAKVKPGNVTNPGNPVSFTFWSDMALATTPLGETTDITPVSLSDSRVTVTPYEYGNGVLTTVKIKADTYVMTFDSDVANIVSWNMADSLDRLARTALDGGTTIDFVGQTTSTAIVATNILTADEVRQKQAELSASEVQGWAGDLFMAVIHPHVAYDLKGETGDGAWIAPHQYVDTQAVYNNEIGTFGGFKFLETSRAALTADGGSSTVDIYTNYFFGRECLAKAETIPGHVVSGPVTDSLMRFRPLGWHAYVGYDTLREAALSRLISASSIGDNS